jgi:hypothetical protein
VSGIDGPPAKDKGIKNLVKIILHDRSYVQINGFRDKKWPRVVGGAKPVKFIDDIGVVLGYYINNGYSFSNDSHDIPRIIPVAFTQ